MFDRKSYFNFLGLLNKINIFLKHLNCRDCGHLLKPNPEKEKHFGFYRVSNFICSNAQCQNKKNVYLSHCLGARKRLIKSTCDNTIDSRDTIRCNYSKHNPSNDYEKYGPYICNVCGSCCSQTSLEKLRDQLIERKWKMQPGLPWKVDNKVGHLDKNEIFCYKCGIEMINNEVEYKDFVHMLEKSNSKKGINHKGFWFIVKEDEEFFEKAEQVGLRISNTFSSDSNVKFISEGNINLLICHNCNTKYNKTKVEFIVDYEPTIDLLPEV